MLSADWLDAGLLGLLGLLVGSFLNVVIYRLPKMMENQWAAECAEMTASAGGDAAAGTAAGALEANAKPAFNLMVPRSRCQQCGHQIRWFENIPVASYLFLRGKCANCSTPISPRYPTVEIVTGALFAWCAWKWGLSVTALAWCAFSAAIVALAMIDWDTTFLPDDITLPLLWGGLIAAALKLTAVPLPVALWGAVAGYLSLWSIYWAFKLITGKEGMGYGDFKLFAALGAWFGWPALIPMILMASVIGAIVGIAMKFSSGLREGGYIPFGPFLAGAGLTAMFFGPQTILSFIGL
jgi:leader peptidase (prepilin peptidase) / N-methyltransferase